MRVDQSSTSAVSSALASSFLDRAHERCGGGPAWIARLDHSRRVGNGCRARGDRGGVVGEDDLARVVPLFHEPIEESLDVPDERLGSSCCTRERLDRPVIAVERRAEHPLDRAVFDRQRLVGIGEAEARRQADLGGDVARDRRGERVQRSDLRGRRPRERSRRRNCELTRRPRRLSDGGTGCVEIGAVRRVRLGVGELPKGAHEPRADLGGRLS